MGIKPLFIDVFINYVEYLTYTKANTVQPLRISKKSFEELKNWVIERDAEDKNMVDLMKGKWLSKSILPNLMKEEPEFLIEGFIFKIEISGN